MNKPIQISIDDNGAVRMIPQMPGTAGSLVPELIAAFESHVRDGASRFILDLQRIEQLSPDLIAVLYELTARARRSGGDLEVIQLRLNARDQLLTFNPLSYLSIPGGRAAEGAGSFRGAEGAGSFRGAEGPEPAVFESRPRGVKVEEIPSRVDALYRATDFVVEIARNMGFKADIVGKIKLAVYEACLNCIEHAYHSDPDRIVKVEVERAEDHIKIVVIDDGEGFEAERTADFDVVAASTERSKGGMGLHIIRKAMDEVIYQRDPYSENRLIMKKYLTS